MENERVDLLDDLLQRHLETYLPLARKFLLEELRLPAKLVGSPQELLCYINGQWTHHFLIMPKGLLALSDATGADFVAATEEGACFLPGARDRLLFRPAIIAREAGEADIAPVILTEILIAHECVHVAMMAHLNVSVPGPACDWAKKDELRYIHEALALRFCAALPRLTDNRIVEASIQRYVNYVESRSRTSPDGHSYIPYFDRYAGVADNELWHKLSDGVATATALAG